MAYTTQQKRILADVIESAENPLTPQEICDLGRKQMPRLGIATVYRTLKQALDEGWVRIVDIPGASPRYESSKRTHHHFFLCQACQRIFNLVGCLGGINSLAPSGFEVEKHEIILYGRCKSCR